MAGVIGICGVFLKSANAQRLRHWYSEHIGIQAGEEGVMFHWRSHEDPALEQMTVWSIFPQTSTYFDPSKSPVMLNYIVDDLAGMLAQLRASGVTVDEKVEEHEYGKFGWFMDPDDNRVEFWNRRRVPNKRRVPSISCTHESR